MQTRLDEKEAAEKRATTSESEAAELSKRLVELKMGEIERMNEVSMTPSAAKPACKQAALIPCNNKNDTTAAIT